MKVLLLFSLVSNMEKFKGLSNIFCSSDLALQNITTVGNEMKQKQKSKIATITNTKANSP